MQEIVLEINLIRKQIMKEWYYYKKSTNSCAKENYIQKERRYSYGKKDTYTGVDVDYVSRTVSGVRE